MSNAQAAAVAIRFEYPGRAPAVMQILPALDFLARLRGLIGQPLPAPCGGLWIEPCAAIHTLGMRMPIDVVFVSRDLRVRRIDEGVLPWRLRSCRRSRAVIEMPAGQARRFGIVLGSRIVRAGVLPGKGLPRSILGLPVIIDPESQP